MSKTLTVETFVPQHRLLLVSIGKFLKDRGDYYNATRYAWRLDLGRAKKTDYVLGCVKGVVKGVYQVTDWLDASPGVATARNFPGFVAGHRTQRWGFVGFEADKTVRQIYEDKLVPEYLEVGQNPIRYYGC